jgi:hypothetical protein
VTAWCKKIIPAVWLVLSIGCGGSNPQVWLKIQEDGSLPCLGASHMRVELHAPNNDSGDLTFDEFGLFFNTDNFNCAIMGGFSFPDLPLGSDFSLEMSLSDSTTENKGILSQGTSVSFNVSSGSPTQEVTIGLYRTPGVQQGTLVVYKPDDWNNVSGIQILQFRITKDGETTPARAYYLTYDPVSHPDPFPLVISNLPAPTDMELYNFTLEGLDGQQNVLRAWNKVVGLQAGFLSFLSHLSG